MIIQLAECWSIVIFQKGGMVCRSRSCQVYGRSLPVAQRHVGLHLGQLPMSGGIWKAWKKDRLEQWEAHFLPAQLGRVGWMY
jgi:hypothetical protein